jgi:regulator of protease activity HflC (stomatin/prohibitin superfamily)
MNDSMNYFHGIMMMIVAITIILFFFVYLVFFRSNKKAELDNFIVTFEPGKYKIRLAPGLDLIQAFVESIAERISPTEEMKNCQSVKFFAIRDQKNIESDNAVYFLVITFQNGMIEIQGVRPPVINKSNNIEWIMQLVEDTILTLPIEYKYCTLLDSHLIDAVQDAAGALKFDTNWLIINVNKKSVTQQVLSGKYIEIDFGLTQ